MKKVISRGKRSKTLNVVKSGENINKNPQSFQDIHFVQKEVLPLRFKIFIEAFIRIGESFSPVHFSDKKFKLFFLKTNVKISCHFRKSSSLGRKILMLMKWRKKMKCIDIFLSICLIYEQKQLFADVFQNRWSEKISQYSQENTRVGVFF